MASEFNRRIATARLIGRLAEDEHIQPNEVFDTIICSRENLSRVRSLVSGDKVQSDFELLILKQLYASADKNTGHDEHTLFARNDLLRKLGGKQDTVLRLVRQFVSGHSDSCAHMIEHIKNNDFMGARSVMHDIIGITGNLCCTRAYNAACELRMELHAEKAGNLENFRGIWNDTIEVLNIFIKLNDPDTDDTEPEIPFEQTFGQFIELCRDFDIRSADFFEENRHEFLKAFGEREFERIESAVNRYELDWIAENIKYPVQ